MNETESKFVSGVGEPLIDGRSAIHSAEDWPGGGSGVTTAWAARSVSFVLERYATTGYFTRSSIGEALAQKALDAADDEGGNVCGTPAGFEAETTTQQLETVKSSFATAYQDEVAAEAEGSAAAEGSFLDEMESSLEDVLEMGGGEDD